MKSPSSGWSPRAHDVDHAGNPLGSERLFVVPPPAQIGELMSAWSSVRRGTTVASIWKRVSICVLWTTGFLCLSELAILLGRYLWHLDEDTALLIRGAGLSVAPCAGLLAAFQIDWSERCTFVGTAGVAEYIFRRRKTRANVLRFEDAFDFRGRE